MDRKQVDRDVENQLTPKRNQKSGGGEMDVRQTSLIDCFYPDGKETIDHVEVRSPFSVMNCELAIDFLNHFFFPLFSSME